MSVKFIDFSKQYELVKDEIDIGLKKVFEKGNFILGQEAVDFENSFAKYCDSKYAVGVNSGTDALYLAVAALDITVGDEVILPSYTFIATALCVSYTGATPVFVEIEEDTYNIDPAKLKKAITSKTKAVIIVHLYGQPANMDEISAICREKGIAVIEDAAQSHGATYKGQKVGSLGDIACFSFYPTKSLGAFGDGGMVVTKSKELYDKVFMLRDYGRKNRYDHKIKGYNSRLDTIQAVVLSAKLKHLDQWNKMRAENAKYYNEQLAECKNVITPQVLDDRTHIYQTYAIRVPNRDKVAEQMTAQNISVLIHYPIPIHLQEAYQDAGYKTGDLPISEKISNEILSLPMYPHMTRADIDLVCDTLKRFV
ncbi:MAG: DegT/DnrJ/EryC1/StrS family aminotransferase [Candidatus Omnitrophica bacterium]|nr:DegT/DnrJ/EryC1/StrS family aminotransferase [Candidatus Omnitrophota bacterium]